MLLTISNKVEEDTIMEPYEPLEIEIIAFDTEDVITTSNDDIDTPWSQ